MPRINKRTVDAIKPDIGQRTIIWDDKLPGFGIVVRPSGVHSFIFQYRNAEGRSRRATVAKVGSLAPDAARDLAEGMAATVKRGGDPLANKKAAREALTVGELLDAYLDSAKFSEKADSTRGIDRGRIKRHLRPILGARHVHKLESEDIRRAFGAIRDGKTAATVKTGKRGLARVKGGEGTARMAIRLLRSIFTWAVQEKMIAGNPAEGVSLGADGVRDIVLEADDYARLFKTLTKMEAEKRVRGPVADAIRLIALTGARRNEVAALRWAHVNLKAGTITLPPSAHKSGRKTGKARVIMLPAAAQEIIARQTKGKPGDFVFKPSKGSKGAVALSKPWRAIRAEAKLSEGIGLHGLRHSLATLLAVGGAQAAEIMGALGHRNMATSQRYVHMADKARAALAERAAAPAIAGMAAAAGEPSAEVVSIVQRKPKARP
ncbi:MAG: site-specific integrase [Alphaproteobacteria bacterium]